MKKLMALIVAGLGLASCALAETESVGGYTWSYRVVGADAVEIWEEDVNLPGEGTRAVSPTPTGVLTIPSMLGGKRVTAIGEEALGRCWDLTSVLIPDSVTSIDRWAFSCCGLTSVTIPSSVTSVGNWAFDGCESLMIVMIPDSVMEIGYRAFYDCTAVTDVYLHADPALLTWDDASNDFKSDGSTKIHVKAAQLSAYMSKFGSTVRASFVGDLDLFEVKTETVGGYTWSYRIVGGKAEIYNGGFAAISPRPTGALTIPSTLGGKPVTSIGVHALGNCGGLTSVTIPTSVTSIGADAFQACSRITNMTIPNSVTSIGAGAFSACSGLTAVTIPNSVTSIGDRAFAGCSGLTDVTIPNSVTSIGIGVFEDCDGLTSVTIPNSVTSIGSSAFAGCDGLTSVTIPSSVASIGSSAFEDCDGLTSVTIPAGVSSIGERAFWACSRLTSVTIPVTVNSIGDQAFGVCSALADVYLLANPAALTWGYASDSFKHDKATKIHVKAEQLSAYESKFGATVNATFVGDLDNTETVGGYTWSYRVVGDTAEIYKDFAGHPGVADTAVSPKPTGAVTIPSTLGGKTVTSIGEGALSGCSGLTGVTIPDSVTSIGEFAFVSCDSLTSVTIPAGVTSIGANAFYSCTAVTDVYCHPDPASLTWGDASDSFKSDGSTKIHVKAAQLSAYESKFGSTVNGTFVGDLSGGGGSGGSEPVAPDPETPCYEMLNAENVTAPYVPLKTVVLKGAAYDGCSIVGIVELKLGKVNARKQTSKVSGSFIGLDGKKTTIKAVAVTGIDGKSPVAVVLDAKEFGNMAVTIGGEQFAGSLGAWHVQSADVGGNWGKATATVSVDSDDVSKFAGTVLTNLLPKAEQTLAVNGKWAFAKAASVKWTKLKAGTAQPEIYDALSGKGLVVNTADKPNLSSLKLTYTPKKGTFKGSFKVYELQGSGAATRLKKYTFKVNGVVVGGVGYGTATCKNPATVWSVSVQ